MSNQKNLPETEERSIEELFLLHLRYKESLMVKTGGNQPILLDDPEFTWIVYRGSADLFAVPIQNDQLNGARTHLFPLEAGDAAFGSAPSAESENLSLILVSRGATQFLKVKTDQLKALSSDEDFEKPICDLVNRWVRNMTGILVDELPPKDCKPIKQNGDFKLKRGEAISAYREILWARHTVGNSRFAEYDDLPLLNGKLRWPLSEYGWIKSVENSEVNLIDTSQLFSESPNWIDLAYFQAQIRLGLSQRLADESIREQARYITKTEDDKVVIDKALRNIMRPLDNAKSTTPQLFSEDPLLVAIQKVAQPLNVAVSKPPPEIEMTIDNIARLSRFQIRKVALKGSWWQEDNGNLVGFVEDGHHPIALLKQRRGYEMYDPTTEQYQTVSDEVVEVLEPFAYMLYRPLPTENITVWKLVKFGVQNNQSDYRRIALMGMLVGLISMIIPIATGALFDFIIPSGNLSLLWQVGIMLLVGVIAMVLFQIVQNLSALRLQTKMGAEVQAGVWDRVLSLPASFFRDYSAGDLGQRVMGITQIQQMLSGTAMSAILASIFSVFSLVLLFVYNVRLAFTAVGLVSIAVGVTGYLGYKQVAFQRAFVKIQGELSSIVLQAIQGISKFRAAGAEGRAFAEWGRSFAEYKTVNYESRETANKLMVFNSSYQIVTTMVIFSVVAFSIKTPMSTGEFLAFNTAFLQFFGGVLTLSMTVISISNIVPLYERAKPILHTLPEIDELKKSPGILKGHVTTKHLDFRYDENGPLVLEDVSVEAKPGEFIALVGSSGSGKSTLFRILLGFEEPEAGAVYYDDHLLSSVDVREVRRQLGVVLQNGQVTAGDIFSNIVGTSNLTLQDAWEAAEMAGLNRDIKDMPMGMHTVLGQGGGTLSGGQRQRLLIARAIANRPRILYFDEATSALDGQTQAIVSESLESLQATRVVIAHRLSTIINADRIYVMDSGRIVEQGNYQELIAQDGVFAQLASRQIV